MRSGPPMASPSETAGLKWPPEIEADRVGHGEHGEAEGERHAGEADAELGEARGEHGAAAAAEHEPEGAERLGGEFVDHCRPR